MDVEAYRRRRHRFGLGRGFFLRRRSIPPLEFEEVLYPLAGGTVSEGALDYGFPLIRRGARRHFVDGIALGLLVPKGRAPLP